MNDGTDPVRATPEGDGHKYFECDDGWGPLISELEVKLKVLSPGYRPSQVKEKSSVVCATTPGPPKARGDIGGVLRADPECRGQVL